MSKNNNLVIPTLIESDYVILVNLEKEREKFFYGIKIGSIYKVNKMRSGERYIYVSCSGIFPRIGRIVVLEEEHFSRGYLVKANSLLKMLYSP